ncbi:MAG: hypothetical protein R8M45_08920, partial [Ghiorsea sp.]
GVANGGAGSDGQYPLTDAAGVTIQVNCPAQMQADVDAKIAETTAKEGQPNGIATLDANGEVPALPSGAGSAVSGTSLLQDGTWATPNIKTEALPDDYQLQVWADGIRTGSYNVNLTIAQGNLAVGGYYVEVIRRDTDTAVNQYRTMTATKLDGVYGQKFTTTCTSGVWTAWKRIAVDEPLTWIVPTLTAPWVASPTLPITYAKDSLGMVHIKGAISGGSNTVSSNILNLPAGHFPIKDLHIPVLVNNGIASIYISTTGTINSLTSNTHTGNAAVTMFLDGISFKAA